MKLPELTYIKQSELRVLRKKYYEEQDGMCPILKIKIPFEKSVVDHFHGIASDKIGENWRLLIRGVIFNGANSAEGKMLKAYKRCGLQGLISFPDYLRNLADYIENPPLINLRLVHPSGYPKKKRLGVRQYNKVIKNWKKMFPRRKEPDFPKSGKIGKTWEEYIRLSDEVSL